jgi:hypothetical protein
MDHIHDATSQNKIQSISASLNEKTVQNKARTLQDNRPAPTLQTKANNTGLPDHLKSGIENLSGHSMDDVKVHYNSDKPAQLNAHAYAQGTDIHIASGQEKHLAHEAWHVVQQKQGRVKPTLQMKGKVNINDDKGLEKEADVMGARAIQMKSKNIPNHFTRKNPSTIIQRRVSVRVNKEDRYKGDFNSYLDALNTAVEKAYFFVIHYPDLKSYAQLDGHTEHWVEAWNNFVAGKEKGQGLINAAFGYAVETLATVIYLPAPGGGLSVELQGIRTGTRPDIILKDGDADVGWLDITASGSEEHVWKKAGWLTKDINKGEVSYPSLDPGIIKHNVANKIQYDDQTDHKTILHRVNYFKYIQALRRLHWKNIGEKYFGAPLDSNNKDKKRQYIRTRLAEYLGLSYYDLPPQTLGSVLRAMGQGASKHGYDVRGLSRAKGESILQEHDRELPGVENFSPQVMQSITESANMESMQKIIADSNSGKSGFNPAFHYNPSLSDESLQIQTRGSVKTVSLAARYQSYLGKNINLNFFQLHSLFSRMKKSMPEHAIKKFGIKIKLIDGTIGRVRIDQLDSRFLRSYYVRAIKLQQYRQKKKNALVWKKRNQISHSSASEHQVVPFGSTTTPQDNLTLAGHDTQLLTVPLSFQVIGFGFHFENGNQIAVTSAEDFQQPPTINSSHKEIQ